MTFKEAAIKAYCNKLGNEAIRAAEFEADHLQKAIKALYDNFGQRPDGTEGSDVIVDGVKLRWFDYYDEHYHIQYFAVVDKCPRCGEETPSGECQELEDIGEMVKGFTPSYKHRCYIAPVEPKDVLERIALALENMNLIAGY